MPQGPRDGAKLADWANTVTGLWQGHSSMSQRDLSHGLERKSSEHSTERKPRLAHEKPPSRRTGRKWHKLVMIDTSDVKKKRHNPHWQAFNGLAI